MSITFFYKCNRGPRRTRDSVVILNGIRALEANVLANVSAGTLQLSDHRNYNDW